MRSRRTRDLAEEALATLLVHLGDHGRDLIVIGGLNPDLLTDTPPAPHLGTTDVDLLLEVGLIYDRDELDFSWLEAALARAGFTPTPARESWRWQLVVDGVPVRLELLCDVPDNPGSEIALPGSRNVTAMNLSGPAPALEDAQERALPVPGAVRHRVADAPESVVARFAGLGGFLLTKAAAVVGRQERKDSYDLVFVLLYNTAGGPSAAADAVAAALPDPMLKDYVGDLRAALDNFGSPDDDGPRTFAKQMRSGGDSTEEDVLAQDAVSAVIEFWDAFDQLLPREWKFDGGR